MHAAGKTKKDINQEIIAIFLLAASLLILASLFTASVGVIGSFIQQSCQFIAGKGAFLLAVLGGFWGIVLLKAKENKIKSARIWGSVLGLLVILTAVDLLLAAPQPSFSSVIDNAVNGTGGGITGGVMAWLLFQLLGWTGSVIVLTVAALIALIIFTELPVSVMTINIVNRFKNIFGKTWRQLQGYVFEEEDRSEAAKATAEVEADKDIEFEEYSAIENTPVFGNEAANSFPENRSQVKVLEASQREPYDNESKKARQLVVDFKIHNYQPPSVKLLAQLQPPPREKKQDSNTAMRVIEETLDSFGVQAKVTNVSRGPAITRFELQPAAGIKVSRIVNLADDISLALAAPGVRIEAPIPGKSAVGIEVPNKEAAVVPFRDLLISREYQQSIAQLPVVLGKDIAGKTVIADLEKMPHLLVAGATGSGKSVCLNTIINSILFKKGPEEVKFVLVDPKRVELTNYNGIPHLLSPVVTSAKKAAISLKWLVKEMERRYELFSAAGVRDLTRYNELVYREMPEGEKEALPLIVIIVDELSDLMMVAPTDVEDSIVRLAQMARAAGMHLVIATQRPSVDVITGLIKANIMTRIAFAVSSQTDSRTILDIGGAEKLLGCGDMLYLAAGASKPVRIQNAFLSDKDVEAVVNHLKNQAGPEPEEEISMEDESLESKDFESEDDLFPRAVETVVLTGHASISLLQRRLRVGYARAARLVDCMENKGIIGGYEGSKPRQVLITKEQYQQQYAKSGQIDGG